MERHSREDACGEKVQLNKTNQTKELSLSFSLRFGPSFENDWTTNYVLGGVHMTRVANKSIENDHFPAESYSAQANYLPNAILKQVSASEGCKTNSFSVTENNLNIRHK